ncbi:hypothetical protein E4U21_005608 [Claviceps maximensis]|nr:hypothetical protein E4U21_005608 [Claviceps maximensis]
MSRYIDRLPEPTSRTPVKVIVATASSIYEAMKILGYKTYHMVECCTEGGLPHIQILTEAIRAEHNRFSGIKRYTKTDFDKWLAEYECIVEIPFFLGSEMIKAYADDPNVKFILTDRDADKWVDSFNNTLGREAKSSAVFPMNILKHFDGYLGGILGCNSAIYGAVADGTLPGDENNRAAVRRNYIS